MFSRIERAEQAREEYYSLALAIQVRLETEPLTDAERRELERERKLYRRFWRHHAKVARQLRDTAKQLNRL